jgi:hypothetical protein
MATFSIRTLRLPSAPVHGTLFVPAVAEPAAAVLLIGGSGGSEPSYRAVNKRAHAWPRAVTFIRHLRTAG